jgi:large subunit ribosomal protein L21
MKYAIVESGGKQYKAVEGEPIEVDRLPVDAGDNVGLERVLMVVDGEDITVGTPTVEGVQVSTTVTEHFKGPKIIVFKYSPKKRIRVKRGHRQQYTRLMVNAIGSDGGGKASKSKKAEAPVEKKAEAKAEKKEATASATKEKKAKKAPAKKETTKKTEKAPAKKAPAKKTTTKKSTAKKSSSTKKSEK